MTDAYGNWSAPLSSPAPLSPGRFLMVVEEQGIFAGEGEEKSISRGNFGKHEKQRHAYAVQRRVVQARMHPPPCLYIHTTRDTRHQTRQLFGTTLHAHAASPLRRSGGGYGVSDGISAPATTAPTAAASAAAARAAAATATAATAATAATSARGHGWRGRRRKRAGEGEGEDGEGGGHGRSDAEGGYGGGDGRGERSGEGGIGASEKGRTGGGVAAAPQGQGAGAGAGAERRKRRQQPRGRERRRRRRSRRMTPPPRRCGRDAATQARAQRSARGRPVGRLWSRGRARTDYEEEVVAVRKKPPAAIPRGTGGREAATRTS